MSVSGGMRIDEAARSAGMTARNIRAYQSLGLLPAPRLAGRVGLYDAGHLERLGAIERLQAQGFSLAGIKALFDAHDRGQTLGAVLGLDRTVAEPADDPTAPHVLRLALVPGPWAHHLVPSAAGPAPN